MEVSFNQAMQMVAGESQKKSQEKQLSAEDKKKISSAYFQLFYALSFTNWIQGKSLGQAWYKAIEQMKSFISSKNPENPTIMYMRQIFAAHKTKWSQHIMTSPLKDKVLELTPEKKQEWNMKVAKSVNEALKILNEKIALYEPEKKIDKNNAKGQSGFLSAQQKMQMLIMWQIQNQNQRQAS